MERSDQSDYWRGPLNRLLREPPKRQWTHSAYALEYNPWTSRSDVEAALLFRGVIVSASANIETQMGRLALRLSRDPECERLRDRFPYSLRSRISFLRKAFTTEKLAKFSPAANAFFDRFERSAILRHIAAHAYMGVLSGGVEFNDFPMSDADTVTSRTEHFTLAELERHAWRAALLSRLGHRFMLRLEAARVLPDANN